MKEIEKRKGTGAFWIFYLNFNWPIGRFSRRRKEASKPGLSRACVAGRFAGELWLTLPQPTCCLGLANHASAPSLTHFATCWPDWPTPSFASLHASLAAIRHVFSRAPLAPRCAPPSHHVGRERARFSTGYATAIQCSFGTILISHFLLIFSNITSIPGIWDWDETTYRP